MSSSLLQQAASSKAVRWIGFGWIGFITENVVISDNREWIIQNYGNDNYHMAYSLLSTLTSGSILYGYLRCGRGQGPRLPQPSTIRKVSSFAFTTLGLCGLSQYFPRVRTPYTYEEQLSGDNSTSNSSNGMRRSKLQAPETDSKERVWRCPMDFRPKDAVETEDGIQGVDRVTRHGMFWSLGSLAMGKALTSVFLPEVVMFSFPLAFAYIGGAHQDQRFLRGSGGTLTQEKYDKTSNVPFYALVTGKQSWSSLSDEIKYSNVYIALFTSLLLALKKVR